MQTLDGTITATDLMLCRQQWCRGRAPRRPSCWNINAFCMLVKAFLWIQKMQKLVHKIAALWVLNYAREIIQVSQGCFSRMPFDTSPDLAGQNVLKTFWMAVWHNRRTTQTQLERVFCRWVNFHLCSNFFGASRSICFLQCFDTVGWAAGRASCL